MWCHRLKSTSCDSCAIQLSRILPLLYSQVVPRRTEWNSNVKDLQPDMKLHVTGQKMCPIITVSYRRILSRRLTPCSMLRIYRRFGRTWLPWRWRQHFPPKRSVINYTTLPRREYSSLTLLLTSVPIICCPKLCTDFTVLRSKWFYKGFEKRLLEYTVHSSFDVRDHTPHPYTLECVPHHPQSKDMPCSGNKNPPWDNQYDLKEQCWWAVA